LLPALFEGATKIPVLGVVVSILWELIKDKIEPSEFESFLDNIKPLIKKACVEYNNAPCLIEVNPDEIYKDVKHCLEASKPLSFDVLCHGDKRYIDTDRKRLFDLLLLELNKNSEFIIHNYIPSMNDLMLNMRDELMYIKYQLSKQSDEHGKLSEEHQSIFRLLGKLPQKEQFEQSFNVYWSYNDPDNDEKVELDVSLLPLAYEAKLLDENRKPHTLLDIINSGGQHSYFIGEGGIGKTTSLMHIWQQRLTDNTELPLYIRLNEYNTIGEPDSAFIRNKVEDLYNCKLTAINTPILLMLDGFNEISSPTAKLINEIKLLLASPNLRIIITSRTEAPVIQQISGFQSFYIQPLDESTVNSFLERN